MAAYLITGKENALIDMGYRSSADSIISDISNAGVGTIDYLLPTHVHLDHAGSCGTLAKEFPEAAILTHPIGEKHLVDPARLVEDASALFGSLIRQYGVPEPIAASHVHTLGDGDTISLGRGLTLRSIWTPGHASHHLSFLVEETLDVVTGDAVGVCFPEVPVLCPQTPPPSFNLDKALSSIGKLRALNPSDLYTPHFGRLRHPESWLDRNTQALLEWNAIINHLNIEGLSTELIAEELIRRVSLQIGIAPEAMPMHLQVAVQVGAVGFIRWLRHRENLGGPISA